MYQINVNRINGRLAEIRLSKRKLASQLGITQPTLSRYFKTPEAMPYWIIAELADLLCETPEEAMGIFFAENLHNT